MEMDEFSDFQMAVLKPSPNVVGVGLPYGNSLAQGKKGSPGIRFPDSSPLHSVASHSKADVVVHSSNSKPLVPPAQKFGTNVGSRLANYDLGLSVPSLTNGVDLSTPPKAVNYQQRAGGLDLLIGEEDKYSALRMLTDIETDATISIFEAPAAAAPHASEAPKPVVAAPSSNITNSSLIQSHPSVPLMTAAPAFHSNLTTSALETANNVESSAGDSSSDFGDFQSFTGFQMNNHQSNHVNSPTIHLNTPFKTMIPASTTAQLSSKVEQLPAVETPGFGDSDAEFGEFVSVEPVIRPPPLIHNGPATPAVVNWSQNLDLANLAVKPPSEEKKGCQNGTNVMDLGYFGTFKNQSYQKPEEKEGKCQEVPHNGLPFSNNYSISEQRQVPNCFQTDHNNLIASEELVKQQQQPPLPALPTSSFIRTSLIRNDEVTDIDATKWSQSEDSNNDCALEYTAYERKDFGKSKFLDVSPETRSIASLDLGNYVTVDYTEANVRALNEPQVQTQNSLKPHAPVPLHHSSADEPIIYDDYDKYQCFREESENEKERCSTEWIRCLQACKAVVSKAFSVFNSVSTSEVIREVVSDEKGYSYIMNILEIYRLSQRIHKSALQLGLESKVETIFMEINNSWETLTAFLLGTCVSTEICQENADFDYCEPQDTLPSCGVCLCSVDITQSSRCVDYGRKMYHCRCANFWINEVDAILPSLSYLANCSSGGGNQMSKSEKNSLV